jgi:molecular chaperone GrpE
MSSTDLPPTYESESQQGTADGANAHAQGAAADDAATSQAASAPDLQAELERVRAEGNAHYESFLRAKAETENARRRAQEEVAKARKFGTESFAESLVPVMDSLEAALNTPEGDVAKLREGVELTLRQLQGAFERNQMIAIDPLGQRFDPHRHQAISTQPVTGVEANHVAAVLQKGWMIADRVLRPALVTVAQ